MIEQQETRAKGRGLCFGKTRILEVGYREQMIKLKRFLTILKPRSMFGMRPALIQFPSRPDTGLLFMSGHIKWHLTPSPACPDRDNDLSADSQHPLIIVFPQVLSFMTV